MAGKRKLTARQIRWLFATGRLRASGKGKDRKVSYSKDGNGRKVPSKAERDKTRAARIEAGRAMAAYGVRKAAFRQNRSAQARALADQGYTLSVQSSARRRADGMKSTKAAARMVQAEKKQAKQEARGNRIRAARQAAGRNPKVQKFRAMEETLGRDGALKALKNRSQRIAAGRATYEAFKKRRNSLYSGSLF
ncbi:hypothetical protein DEIPH_ctg011orf0025 [Deinococcus phoenicis]|uniref:Uncharacterized protein n=1 Tax=Deinococcus phoenicis TaxID=1476583 RepID=A0A016QTH0_9DEIO|nr:hypothetical protein [Deinococcus phoenicis]EYB69059.1 hypothetical protein DEIPH_ctg011orf0025 [Deinococcus phoenicis]